MTGNLKIISDLRIRYIVSKGPKYRFPSRIDFKKCREEIASASNDFGNRWCKREYVDKRLYKAQFIASSCSCTATELSKLLISCLTADKNHVIRYCEKVYERSGKNLFWSIKNSGEVFNKLKLRGFCATNLSTYDFSTLYTTLPHNLSKENL